MKCKHSYRTLLILGMLMLYFSGCSDDEVFLPDVQAIPSNSDPVIVPGDGGATITVVSFEELRTGLTTPVLNFNDLRNGTPLAIEGFIISSDDTKNIQNALYIQDKSENPLLGMRILIDRQNINTSNFGVSRKITLNLNGLGMRYANGVLEVGKFRNNAIVPIESREFTSFISSTSVAENIVPLERTIAEIQSALASPTVDDDRTGILVRITGVQLIDDDLGKTYADDRNNNEVTRMLRSCEGGQLITLINGGASLFKAQEIPQNRGDITAILDGNALRIRDLEDISFTAPLCRQNVSGLEANVTLAQVVEVYENANPNPGQNNLRGFESATFNLPENAVPIVSGFVNRVDRKKNLLYIQDAATNPTHGIAISIVSPQPVTYPIGTKILIQLPDLGIRETENGVLQLAKLDKQLFTLDPIDNSQGFAQIVTPTDDVVNLVPLPVTVATILNNTVPQSVFVQLNDMQLDISQVSTSTTLEEDEFRVMYNCVETRRISLQKGYFDANLPVNFNTNSGVLRGLTSVRVLNNNSSAFLILNQSSDANFNLARCTQ